MEILREYSQIVEATKKVLGIDISEIAMLNLMDDEDLLGLAEHCNVNKDIKQVCDLSMLVFQLNDFNFALVNYIKLFLFTENYDCILHFISKMYVSHISGYNYVSKQKSYNLSERLFDRFVEIVKFGNIELKYYLPLVLECIFSEKSMLYIWHDIAIEFMQNFMRDNEENILDYFETNQKYELEYLSLVLKFNTQKGMYLLFEKNSPIIIKNRDYFLKTYIADALLYFDKYLPQDTNGKIKYLEVLSSIKGNIEIGTRLKNLYETEENVEVKNYIAEKLGISTNIQLGSSKHFKVMARKKVEFPQERSLNISFNNLALNFIDGEEADNFDKTYLINLFKEEKNLNNLLSFTKLFDIFEKQSLQSFAFKLFNKLIEKDDILQAKWCLRLVSILSTKENQRSLFEMCNVLYTKHRNKEAKYLTMCLLYSKKYDFIEMFSRLKKFDAFNANFDKFAEIFATLNNLSNYDVLDVSMQKDSTEEEKSAAIKRLYNSFVSGRVYSKELFNDIFVKNAYFNDIANHLIFGEYSQDKLYSIFKLNGTEIEYLFETKCYSEKYYCIVHSVDLDERFEDLDLYIQNPLFKQIEKTDIDVREINKTSNSIVNFEGVICNLANFTSKIHEKGFFENKKASDELFDCFVCKNSFLNLVTVLELESSITSTKIDVSLGKIRFYKLSECMQDEEKLILNKSKCLSIAAIKPRYLYEIMLYIQNSNKF